MNTTFIKKFNKEILGLVALLLLVSCAKKEEVSAVTISEIQAKKGSPVTTAPVGFGKVRRVEKSEGTLQGISETVLANGMGGTVGSIPVKVGQKIGTGRTVARMTLDGGSPVVVAQSAYDYASQVYERAQKLHDEGAVSLEQVEGARVQYENAKRNLGLSKVGVAITTPFSGTVLEIFQSVGSKIAAETPIVKVADLRTIKVDMQINEKAIHLFKSGQKTFIELENDTLWGKIIRTSLSANGMSHGFRVTAHFKNSETKLMPGMFKHIGIVVEEKEDALYIPIEAVNYSDGMTFVYVVNGETASRRQISTGIRNGEHYEITDGLEASDQIIISGTTTISEGSKINIVN
jgi:membrane fusion protein (multidrug efflux system)